MSTTPSRFVNQSTPRAVAGTRRTVTRVCGMTVNCRRLGSARLSVPASSDTLRRVAALAKRNAARACSAHATPEMSRLDDRARSSFREDPTQTVTSD